MVPGAASPGPLGCVWEAQPTEYQCEPGQTAAPPYPLSSAAAADYPQLQLRSLGWIFLQLPLKIPESMQSDDIGLCTFYEQKTYKTMCILNCSLVKLNWKFESVLIKTNKGEKIQVVLQGRQRDGLEQFLAPVGLRLPEYSKTQDVPEQIAATGLVLHTPSDIW